MGAASDHYNKIKELARKKRISYSLGDQIITLNVLRSIYKQEHIEIHLVEGTFRNLKAAYYNDVDGCDVLLNKKLPKEVRIFALAHELKHHFVDRNRLSTTVPCCMSYGEEPLIEKSAEVFAAEFIWPEAHFLSTATTFGLTQSCTPEQVVHFKKTVTPIVSYKFITKRLEWFNIITKGAYSKVQFKNLEYSLYGKPYYLTHRK